MDEKVKKITYKKEHGETEYLSKKEFVWLLVTICLSLLILAFIAPFIIGEAIKGGKLKINMDMNTFASIYSIVFSLLIAIFIIITVIARLFIKFFYKFSYPDSDYRQFLIDELKLNQELIRANLESDRSDTEQLTENKLNNDKRDIIALMLNNNDEIREYFTISKQHAKTSYWLSVFASIIGLFMLCIAIYAILGTKDSGVAIVGITSGAVTELVAGVVLWIHNKSAMQLNYYYDALHENEKFLAAINMADKLDEETRKEMYIEIIRKQIEINRSENK